MSQRGSRLLTVLATAGLTVGLTLGASGAVPAAGAEVELTLEMAYLDLVSRPELMEESMQLVEVAR